MAVASASDSPRAIVDMVCDVIKAQGFSVDKNPPPGPDPTLSVDIVASRKRGKKTQTLAFECWEGDVQITGKQVEAFVQRIHSLGLEGGVYVSPKGFTGDAEFVARKLGVELWDIPKLREQLSRIKPAQGSTVPATLPVSRILASKILSHTLENGTILRMASLPKLEYRPYVFAKFRTGSGKKTALGVIVLDGVDGRVCDAGTLEGQIRQLPSTGLFTDCLGLQPFVGSLQQLPQGLEMTNTVTIAQMGMSSSQIATKVAQTLENEVQMSPDDFSIIDVSLLHIPIVTVELSTLGKSYRKIVQAATGRMIWDDTVKCSYCTEQSKAICENCGGTACREHLGHCSSCGKHFCSHCLVKGPHKTMLCPPCKSR
jgi:hypothetical protein